MKILKYIVLIYIVSLNESNIKNKLFNYKLVDRILFMNFETKTNNSDLVIKISNEDLPYTKIYKNTYNCEECKEGKLECENGFTSKILLVKVYSAQEDFFELEFCYNHDDKTDNSITSIKNIKNLLKQNKNLNKYILKYEVEPSSYKYNKISNLNIINSYNKFKVTLNPTLNDDDNEKIDVTESLLTLNILKSRLNNKKFKTELKFSEIYTYDVKIFTKEEKLLNISKKISNKEIIEGNLKIKLNSKKLEEYNKNINKLYSSEKDNEFINYLTENIEDEKLFLHINYFKDLIIPYEYIDNDSSNFEFYKLKEKTNWILIIIIFFIFILSLWLTFIFIKNIPKKEVKIDENLKEEALLKNNLTENLQENN